MQSIGITGLIFVFLIKKIVNKKNKLKGSYMKLSSCIHEFFTHYIKNIRGLSPQTLSSYKVSFKLLLPFAGNFLGKKINDIEIQDLKTNLILSFLESLESDRNNCVRTRNIRLAAIKSLAKMIRLLHPECKDVASRIMNIPQKKESKPLVDFLSQEELLKVFNCVNLQKKDGFRDYVILHLLYDSGARASEIADIKIDDINVNNKTVAILGKGQRYRIVQIWEKTVQLVERYAKKYRNPPKLGHQDYLFINQRGEKMTRHGIYRICKKYLSKALPEKRLINLNSVHCFRHYVESFYMGSVLIIILGFTSFHTKTLPILLHQFLHKSCNQSIKFSSSSHFGISSL